MTHDDKFHGKVVLGGMSFSFANVTVVLSHARMSRAGPALKVGIAWLEGRRTKHAF